MSGHSHWATIKHKKASLDSRRGRLWSKLSKNVIATARAGGGNPDMNPRLRLAIDKAKAANMPKDTIEKAIKKGTGELEGVSYEEIMYEGYGPNGVAIMAQILTDNRNRTAPEVKKLFERCGGSLSTTNSVAWMFSRKGLFVVSDRNVDEEKLMELVLDAGADDIQHEGELFTITTDPNEYEKVKKALEQANISVQSSELAMIPATTVTLNAEVGKRVLRLMEELDDHDDVQNVYANFDIPQEVMTQIEKG
jgi:YebC/PmpR family DNA-binding regulatory protein